MTAKEYFVQVRDVRRRMERHRSMVEAMRSRESVRAQSYDPMPHGKGGVTDARATTDARMDMEGRIARESADMDAAIADARSMCAGVRAANPHHSIWGDALELRYVEDLSWRSVADALLVSQTQARAEVSGALDWIDAVGIAAARSGVGQAALF